ncbi:MAG: hypothetical protein EOO27_01035 [Comamonadaceae bacterium]|nr:MAG: hypothetical protein EOO27_01035 [Comamonadaceae bacterium]
MPASFDVQPREVDLLNALHALPDAWPVWRPYACVTLTSAYSGTIRMDFVLRTREFQGRTRWFWGLVKVAKLGAGRAKKVGAPPIVKFR